MMHILTAREPSAVPVSSWLQTSPCSAPYPKTPCPSAPCLHIARLKLTCADQVRIQRHWDSMGFHASPAGLQIVTDMSYGTFTTFWAGTGRAVPAQSLVRDTFSFSVLKISHGIRIKYFFLLSVENIHPNEFLFLKFCLLILTRITIFILVSQSPFYLN